MRTMLICPGERSTVSNLCQHLPLAHVPVLGQSLLEYWLSALALQGASQIGVLAHAHPDLTQELVGTGERWGLNAKVISESRELTPAEALLKYSNELETAPAGQSIIVLDHFPTHPELPLFASYQHWFAALRGWMPSAVTADRVGVNETRAGIWTGCHSHISAQARLHPPCWIGQHVFVGAGAVIGPETIIEDGSFVEPGAEVGRSWVGPDTFVGQFARIDESLAWGSTLIKWESGSAAQVADPFLLCPLRQPRAKRTLNWLHRLGDVYSRNKAEAGVLWKQLLLHRES